MQTETSERPTLKEVVVFRCPPVVHVYNVVSHARRFYRTPPGLECPPTLSVDACPWPGLGYTTRPRPRVHSPEASPGSSSASGGASKPTSGGPQDGDSAFSTTRYMKAENKPPMTPHHTQVLTMLMFAGHFDDVQQATPEKAATMCRSLIAQAAKTGNAPGLLNLLDEVGRVPKQTDADFCNRVHQVHTGHPHFPRPKPQEVKRVFKVTRTPKPPPLARHPRAFPAPGSL